MTNLEKNMIIESCKFDISRALTAHEGNPEMKLIACLVAIDHMASTLGLTEQIPEGFTLTVSALKEKVKS
jgi:hypothetical protein